MRRLAWILVFLASVPAPALDLRLPKKQDSLRFAVIGDTGTGVRAQFEVGRQMNAYHAEFPFEFVLMLGDNIYGPDTPQSYQEGFLLPYKALLDAGVKFNACLGNHDNISQRSYAAFNLGGERYRTYKPKQGVRFFVLDSNYLDPPQLAWLDKELKSSGSEWKVCYFHHPLYSSGKRHGSSLELRAVLEPYFTKYGVNLVLSGHDHIYERIKPQKGVYYFVSGAGGQLRKGNVATTITEKIYDADYHFMLMEIDGDDLYFQAVNRAGQNIDSGVIKRPPPPAAAVGPPPSPLPTPFPSPPPTPTPQAVASPRPSPSPAVSPSPKPRPTPKAPPPRKKTRKKPRPSPSPG